MRYVRRAAPEAAAGLDMLVIEKVQQLMGDGKSLPVCVRVAVHEDHAVGAFRLRQQPALETVERFSDDLQNVEPEGNSLYVDGTPVLTKLQMKAYPF